MPLIFLVPAKMGGPLRDPTTPSLPLSKFPPNRQIPLTLTRSLWPLYFGWPMSLANLPYLCSEWQIAMSRGYGSMKKKTRASDAIQSESGFLQ